MAERMDGRKNAPGKLDNIKKARIRTATERLTAGVSPATFDIRKVNESSCNP
jgi:hypothetical protein